LLPFGCTGWQLIISEPTKTKKLKVQKQEAGEEAAGIDAILL
jgi:hypothetical protein